MLHHLLLFTITMFCASCVPVTIFNTVPRRDTTGAIMDAHDGKVIGPIAHLGNRYLWYAASYGNCTEPPGSNGCSDASVGNCGFQLNHNVSLWSSLDLFHWKPHGVVFSAASSGLESPLMFCPKVLFNNVTNDWVLWANFVDGLNWGISYYAVAAAKNFTGPFVVVSRNVSTLAFEDVGDFNLFQDDDGTGYVIYTSHINGPWKELHTMSVERLSADYTKTMGVSESSGFFGPSNVEAPAYFKRGSTYYAVFGSCCCYCGGGSPVSVFTASHPLGPYKAQASGPIDPTIAAQQTDIASYVDSAGVEQFLWIGDRWQQAPDHIKGHDPTYWGPLKFGSDGTVSEMKFLDNFTIDVK